ncbi:MAG: hypothetical protein A3K90_05170 [Pelodictyon luteolum]|uniref:DUF302 domain-containing protein n=1 Tax=Pelodictyon luteolum TaxID=1100 RepID=A0A165LWZ6_PELLU|nr:hypothetical protein [Pelodictyon luteolum]KZK74534.1 MAG: hypothetical protein A3K90_05170 [Pelodictyon luteolum]
MKQLWIILLLLIGASAPLRAEKHALDIPAYIKVGDVSKNMETVAAELKAALESRGFEILGSYSPENNSNLRVIAYTRTDLKNAAVKVADRGAMAAVLKVGLVKKNHAVTVSYLNPPYLFNAYLRKETPKHQKVLGTVTADVKAAMGALGNEFTGFGGGMRAEKLWKYRYKIIMPDFGDPEKLNTYSSFEKGLETIDRHLKKNNVHAKEVYRLVFPAKKIAVIGVGLHDPKDGEAKFLPKIGEENIAAMPYEIILEGNTVTMLPGKYRLALSWPELSMGTFMKIVSTPGNIKDMMKAITE